MRYRATIPLVSLFIGLLIAHAFQSFPKVAGAGAICESGCMDMSFYYKPANASRPLVQTPTGEKPQSKLWFNDGRWWGSIFNNVTGKYQIYWLDLAIQTWRDTGVVLDSRAETKADCLWDGTHLYVVSGGGSDLTGAGTRSPWPAVLRRFSYNRATQTYILDSGFPVTVRNGGAETIVIDKDTTGKLWITYTQNSKVYINHSRTSDLDWNPSAAMVVPTADSRWTSLSPDDISSLVAFDGKIGVLWSNESTGQFSGSNDTAFYFAYHVDGADDRVWTSAVIRRQAAVADDHINIKSLQADASGNIFAMVKTSFNNSVNNDPQLLLFVAKKQSNGAYKWNSYVESYRNDRQTRPILLIDSDHRRLYVFTSNESGGYIYYKSTSLDNIQFPPGPGTLFMGKNGFAINNVTSTKQTVNSASGIVVLASYDNEAQVDAANLDYYFHNSIDLRGTGPTVTPNPKTPTATPTATSTPTATTTPRPTATHGPSSSSRHLYIPLLQQ